MRSRTLIFTSLTFMLGSAAAGAATIAPPMLDIYRGCTAAGRHSAAAMSECVVAESEARANLLQHWDKLPDASVEKCLKIGRKAKKLPYVAIEKCLSPDLAAAAAPPAPQGEKK